MKKLTSEHRKIYARELITLNGMTKDELRRHYIEIFDRLREYEAADESGQLAEIGGMVSEYAGKHPIAKTCGSEYIMQDDEAQEDALLLVCKIFDSICEEDNK